MDITTCPECGAPADVVDRHVLESTDGPVEHARVRCVARHVFFLPIASLVTEPSGDDRRAGRSASATSSYLRR
jgi:hypothetical protein